MDTSSVTFKKADVGDVETLVACRMRFLREIQGEHSTDIEVQLTNSLRSYFRHSLSNNTFVAWIAKCGGEPIASGGMVYREQPGNFEIPSGRTGYILSMHTAPGYRNRGIGTAILRKLIEEGTRSHLDKIDLHATIEGEPMYRKLGFTEPHDRALELHFCGGDF